jgi:hypothetical protein
MMMISHYRLFKKILLQLRMTTTIDKGSATSSKSHLLLKDGPFNIPSLLCGCSKYSDVCTLVLGCSLLG